MKFLLDENFPRKAASFAEQRGHVVYDIRGTTEEGLEDRDIFKKAQNLEAIFVTTDADFHHTIPRLFQTHCGVIVILLSQPNGPALLQKFSWALDFTEMRNMQNSCLLLTDNKVYFVLPES